MEAVLTIKTQCNLANAEKYFNEHLQVGDYYGQERARSWASGSVKVRDGLDCQNAIKQDDFVSLCHNEDDPATGELLTQRMKTTRWDATKASEVANRRVLFDFTFSPPKSVSIQAFIGNDNYQLSPNRAFVTAAIMTTHRLDNYRGNGSSALFA